MTFARLIEVARWGAATDNYSTLEEYEDIHDFAKTWHDLLYVELDDFELRKRANYGKWVEEPNCMYRCSNCGSHYPSIRGYMYYRYCPSCGSRMAVAENRNK